MAHYVAAIAPGLGDLVVSLPIVQQLIAQGIETHLVLRSPMQTGLAPRIRGLAGVIKEPDFQRLVLRDSDRYINMREHPLQTDALWGSPEFEARHPGMRIADVVRRIGADFGIEASPPVPLDFASRPDVRDHVLLIPATAGSFKEWPAAHWLGLWRELTKLGHPVGLIGQPQRAPLVAELRDAGVPWIPDANLGEAIDLVSSARAVVAVDTGLMHIALHQGVPTVCLSRSNDFFYRPLPRSRLLHAGACDARCLATEFGSRHFQVLDYDDWSEDAWRVRVPQWACYAHPGERCMAQVPVSAVLEALTTLTR